MRKNGLFFGKNWKIAAALGAPPRNPHWPPAAGGSARGSGGWGLCPQTSELLLPLPVIVILSKSL